MRITNNLKDTFKNPIKTFVIVSVFSFSLFLIFLLIFGVTHHRIFNFGIAQNDPGSWMGDFFEINKIAGENNLERNSNPGLTLLFGKIFYYISGGPVNNTFLAVFSIILFFGFPIFIIIIILNSLLKKRFCRVDRIKIILCLFLSMPFMFLLQRGNYLIYAFLFVVIFLVWYRSNNKIKKESSYVFLSLAIGLKLYPIIFAIILFKKKDWSGLLKMVLYSSFFLVVPFLIFPDGFSVFINTYKNIFTYMGENGGSYDVSLKSFAAFIIWIFTQYEYAFIYSLTYFKVVTLLLSLLFLFLFIFIAINTKKTWELLLLCSLIISLAPSPTYFYTLVFLYIPLVSWLLSADDQCKSAKNRFIFFAFLFIFQPLYLGTVVIPKIKGVINLFIVVKQIVVTVLLISVFILMLITAVVDCKKFLLLYNKKRYENKR